MNSMTSNRRIRYVNREVLFGANLKIFAKEKRINISFQEKSSSPKTICIAAMPSAPNAKIGEWVPSTIRATMPNAPAHWYTLRFLPYSPVYLYWLTVFTTPAVLGALPFFAGLSCCGSSVIRANFSWIRAFEISQIESDQAALSRFQLFFDSILRSLLTSRFQFFLMKTEALLFWFR